MKLELFQKLLTFLVIVLICSITPAVAVQSTDNGHIHETVANIQKPLGGTNTGLTPEQEKEYNQLYKQTIKDIQNAVNEGSNTELTPEQKKYLKDHEDGLLKKSEAILRNIQDFVDYISKESDKYHTGERKGKNPTQRQLLENEDENELVDVIDYLKNVRMNVVGGTCPYDNLTGMFNEHKGGGEGVIIQIKDGDYTRYMQIVNIDKVDIHVRAPRKELTMDIGTFREYYLPSGKVNFIIVSKEGNTQNVLNKIYEFQKNDLKGSISRCDTGKATCTTLLGAMLSGIVLSGVWRCCDSCKAQTANIIEHANVDETTPLNQYGATGREIRDRSCSKCHNPAVVIATGVFAAFLLILGICKCNEVRISCDADLDNLSKYGN